VELAHRLTCGSIVVLIAGCNITAAGSSLRSQTSPSPLPTAKAEPTPTVYSGTVRVVASDAWRTITVVVGTEVDVVYPTAVSVANEDQAAGALVWIGFQPGLITRFSAAAPGQARIIPTGSCPGMNCPPFQLTVDVQAGAW
jgi:hypothetical protein